VSMTTNPREGKSSDAVLAELTQARRLAAASSRAKPTPPSSTDAAKTDTGLRQLSVQAQTAPQRAGPAAAASSPELTQLVQTITRELSNLEQGIEQLKTRQAR
jgi:hypothetical protein